MITDIARRRFDEIVPPLLDDVYALARWLTGDAADADDVAQEVALRALRALAGTRPERPRAWLLAITRNAALTHLAKKRPQALADAADEIADDAPSPEAALIRAAESRAVAAAIDALPLPLREVLIMREISDLSYKDIAEAADIPIGTVMSRLARARAQLAAQLGALR